MVERAKNGHGHKKGCRSAKGAKAVGGSAPQRGSGPPQVHVRCPQLALCPVSHRLRAVRCHHRGPRPGRDEGQRTDARCVDGPQTHGSGEEAGPRGRHPSGDARRARRRTQRPQGAARGRDRHGMGLGIWVARKTF